MRLRRARKQCYKSRSTWACELKCQRWAVPRRHRRHAPRERVSWNLYIEKNHGNSVVSRSTWACELKFKRLVCLIVNLRHAPRERVSWNEFCGCSGISVWVTLHVSVWVEIPVVIDVSTPTVSRSTWACELKYWECLPIPPCGQVTLHVSVWVEIELGENNSSCHKSRSTWACELKSTFFDSTQEIYCHAPRERVSWNWYSLFKWVGVFSSRSTWACELKSSSS